MEIPLRLVSWFLFLFCAFNGVYTIIAFANAVSFVWIGIVGSPADHLLGYEGVEGAQGPRFRKLSKEEIEDYLTNL